MACGKGTYVRTLCHDIGRKLGCGACLNALRRTASGTLDVADALPLDQILTLDGAALAARIIPCFQYLDSNGISLGYIMSRIVNPLRRRKKRTRCFGQYAPHYHTAPVSPTEPDGAKRTQFMTQHHSRCQISADYYELFAATSTGDGS